MVFVLGGPQERFPGFSSDFSSLRPSKCCMRLIALLGPTAAGAEEVLFSSDETVDSKHIVNAISRHQDILLLLRFAAAAVAAAAIAGGIKKIGRFL